MTEAATGQPTAPTPAPTPVPAPLKVVTPTFSADGVADFTEARPPIRFSIDGEEFTAAPAIPAGIAFELAGSLQTKGADQTEGFKHVLGRLLLADSAARFVARLTDTERPISPAQLIGVVYWLLERYGLRPTRPSSNSSPGSGSLDGGMSSTGVPPSPAPPTPSPSPSAGF